MFRRFLCRADRTRLAAARFSGTPSQSGPRTRLIPDMGMIAAVNQRPTHVVCVLGTSFSGSTLLNLVLGAHPAIYGGGELVGLLLNRDKPGAGSCTSCGLECRHWDRSSRHAVTKGNIYRLAERAFAKRVIVDTSKSLDWFDEVLGAGENAGMTASYVLMVKHPIRYLASCAVNIVDLRPRRLPYRALATLGAGWQRQAALSELARDLDEFYRRFFASFAGKIRGSTFHLLHYERLVDSPRQTLGPLLHSLGLGYDPRMDDFYSADHHQIGGNNGAVFQVNHSWGGAEDDIPTARRQFYESTRALRIDDKFRQVFSDAEMSRLMSYPVVRELSERLGYDAPDMPYRI
jgi:hypothetical protein